MGKKNNFCNCDEKVRYDLYLDIDKELHKESTCMKELKNCTAVEGYTNWEKNVIKNFCEKDPECHLLLHCLKRKLTYWHKIEEGLKALIIPFYLAILTVVQAFILDKAELIIMAVFIVVIFIVAIICSFRISNFKDKILFYEECIELIENAKSCHQENGD